MDEEDPRKVADVDVKEGRPPPMARRQEVSLDAKSGGRPFMRREAYQPNTTVVLAKLLTVRMSHTWVIKGWKGILTCFDAGKGFCTGTARCGDHIVYLHIYPHGTSTHPSVAASWRAVSIPASRCDAGKAPGHYGSLGVFVGVNNVTEDVRLKSRVTVVPPPGLSSLLPRTVSAALSTSSSSPSSSLPATAAAATATAATAARIVGAMFEGKPKRRNGVAKPPCEFFAEDDRFYVYTAGRSCLGWDGFANNADMEESRMIENDQLVLRLEIEMPRVSIELDSATPRDSSTAAFFYPDPDETPSLVVGSSWSVPRSVDSALTLQDRMRQMLERGLYPDVHVRASDGYLLPAHKAMLTTRSPIFQAALNSGMLEDKENVIHMPMYCGAVVQALLCFLYTGRISFPLRLAPPSKPSVSDGKATILTSMPERAAILSEIDTTRQPPISIGAPPTIGTGAAPITPPAASVGIPVAPPTPATAPISTGIVPAAARGEVCVPTAPAAATAPGQVCAPTASAAAAPAPAARGEVCEPTTSAAATAPGQVCGPTASAATTASSATADVWPLVRPPSNIDPERRPGDLPHGVGSLEESADLESELFTVASLDWQQLVQLFEAGSLYAIDGLDEWCVSRLVRELQPHTVLPAMKLIAKYACDSEAASRFLKIGLEYVNANLQTVLIPEALCAAPRAAQSKRKRTQIQASALTRAPATAARVGKDVRAAASPAAFARVFRETRTARQSPAALASALDRMSRLIEDDLPPSNDTGHLVQTPANNQRDGDDNDDDDHDDDDDDDDDDDGNDAHQPAVPPLRQPPVLRPRPAPPAPAQTRRQAARRRPRKNPRLQ